MRGLFRNGRLWWMRVPRPLSGQPPVRRSTGTARDDVARKVRDTILGMAEQPHLLDLVEAAAEGHISLLTLYRRHARGELHLLRSEAAEAAREAADIDIEPWVTRWVDEVLPLLRIGEKQRADYAYQIRTLVPEGERFPRSRWTEDELQAALGRIRNSRTGEPLSTSTARRYASGWYQFHKWARKRVPLLTDPWEDDAWVPGNAPPRTVWWDHEQTLRFIEALPDEEHRVFAALVFGSGMEQGAALAFRCGDLGADRTVVARGTKNANRVGRTIILDQWADDIVRPYVEGRPPRESAWRTIHPAGDGKEVRTLWYETQVALGYVEEPPVSPKTGKKLWGKVEDLHNIHDARHTYAVVRLLGADGEPPQDIKYVASQLGHASEQMVMQVYAKANIEQQLKLREMRERRKKSA